MSSLASQKINQEGHMEWLAPFLKRTFFGACSVHQKEQKNDLNRFCITCEESACKHCIEAGTHGDHQLLKIYRHVYKDVVPLEDMQKHIDCTMIQPYRCNKKKVISLNPLPHRGSGKTNKDKSCHVCMRKLLDSTNCHYCCIACKFQVTSSSEKSNDSKSDASKAVPDEVPNVEDEEPQNKRRHKRKGIPCRALPL